MDTEHQRRGQLGERAAKAHLQALGLKYLTANFRSKRGEIDLVFRDADGRISVSCTRLCGSEETVEFPSANVNFDRAFSREAAWLQETEMRPPAAGLIH